MRQPIRLISGTVEIGTGKQAKRETFTRLVVKGETDLQIRQAFDYSRNFRGAERAKIATDQKSGKIRLISYQIDAELGMSNV